MITNKKVTIYHKIYDNETRLEKWIRFNYNKVWCYETKQANLSSGYNNDNALEVRIPYFEELDINNFSIGDIIVTEEISEDISRQQDIKEQTYNITTINDNIFGFNKHIHLGAK